jgi:ATP-binding cassette subfamily C exporter for protease/lipase
VGLARAIYGEPSLIVLDEPNSNLDDAGERALVQAIAELKAMGKTIVLITHRLNILSITDRLVAMNQGGIQAYGPRDEVLRLISQARTAQAQAA